MGRHNDTPNDLDYTAMDGSYHESVLDYLFSIANNTGGLDKGVSSNKGIFGENITSHRMPVVQIANKYRIDPAELEDIETFEATGGSADNNRNLFRCQTGTSVGGYGVIRSQETLNYRAGQGIQGFVTASFTTGIANSLQFAGMFNLTETAAFGYDGTDFSILHSYDGAAEEQLITITATGSGS